MNAFASTGSRLSGAIRRKVLRPYQQDLKAGIYGAWQQGAQNVLAVLPTGGGKTATFSDILADHRGGAVAIAHRQELVGQISCALNENGVRHRIIAPPNVIKLIVKLHLDKHGVTYYDPGSAIAAAGVDSLAKITHGKGAAKHGAWRQGVNLWVGDEAHHFLKGNKWGKAVSLFGTPVNDPQTGEDTGRREGVWGLGVTASPSRSDGSALGRESGDGVFDAMVLGPSMREMIDEGYLTPYRIYSVPCSVEYSNVAVGGSGEFVQAKLVAAEDDSGLVGDIVTQYLKYAAGKLGVTFVSSVDRARRVAAEFCARGVPALALDGTTPDDERAEAIRKLERREVLQLVNCDLFGEGFDLPAIEVVSMGTATASLARYMQWFGRALRLMLTPEQWAGYDSLSPAERRARIACSAKPFALILDHGSNVIRHGGPPDIPRVWSLAKPERGGSKSEALPYRVCLNPGYVLTNPSLGEWADWRALGWSDGDMLAHGHIRELTPPCVTPYERLHRACPCCGYVPMPVSRSEPEHVDGDLQLLEPEMLQQLWDAYNEAHQSVEEVRQAHAVKGTPHVWAMKAVNDHGARLAELTLLEQAMAEWGGIYHARGETDSQIQRRFWLTFGADVISARSLKRAEAEKLRDRILTELSR